ncbi:hypothetical protein [Paraburkholderia sp. JPY465]|uniref:hypothetical protein n=1 Tax=Paraburkholderia sp. JPY465 TaxID=3042285 RepID=UPI003D1FB89E
MLLAYSYISTGDDHVAIKASARTNSSISVRTAWLAHVATFTFRRNRPAPTCSNRRLE